MTLVVCHMWRFAVMRGVSARIGHDVSGRIRYISRRSSVLHTGKRPERRSGRGVFLMVYMVRVRDVLSGKEHWAGKSRGGTLPVGRSEDGGLGGVGNGAAWHDGTAVCC